MRSGGIISLTLKSLPTSGNATPLAQLTQRRLTLVPTRVTPGGRQLPRRKDAYGSGLTQGGRRAASRCSLYFAWGRFLDFCPGPSVHRRRDGMPGPGHEIVSASRLRDESIQLQHIMLWLERSAMHEHRAVEQQQT